MTGIVGQPDIVRRVSLEKPFQAFPRPCGIVLQGDANAVALEDWRQLVKGTAALFELPFGRGDLLGGHLRLDFWCMHNDAAFAVQAQQHLQAVRHQLHAGLALIFLFGVPAFLLAGRAVDVQQGEVVLLQPGADGVQFGLVVEKIRAPLVAPVQMREARLGGILEAILREAAIAVVVGGDGKGRHSKRLGVIG